MLLANPAKLASLTGQQRGWIQQAAEGAAVASVSLVVSQNGTYITQACAMGARFATATPTDLAALDSSLSGVYRSLDRDPQTRAFIGQIQQLKAITARGASPAIPVGCTSR